MVTLCAARTPVAWTTGRVVPPDGATFTVLTDGVCALGHIGRGAGDLLQQAADVDGGYRQPI